MAPPLSLPASSALPSLSKDKELYFLFLLIPLSPSVSTKYVSNTTVSAKTYSYLEKAEKNNINPVIKYCTYSVASSDNYIQMSRALSLRYILLAVKRRFTAELWNSTQAIK